MKFVRQKQIKEVLRRKSWERRELMTWVNVFKRKADSYERVLLLKEKEKEQTKIFSMSSFYSCKTSWLSSLELSRAQRRPLQAVKGKRCQQLTSGWESRGSHDITKRLWDDITNLFLTLIQRSRGMRNSEKEKDTESEKERGWKDRREREWRRKKESASRMKGVTTKSWWGRHTKKGGQIYVSQLPEKRQEETDNTKNHKNTS